MKSVRVRIDEQGHLALPVQHRQALGLKPGDEVTISVEDHALRIARTLTAQAGIAEARRIVRQYDQGSGSPVDDLIAQRRAEARRE
ncbi:AbrB/MazE/SpoVT family DNA-binding domain-containing protein [Azospirillum sp.]|uniref:AbrB/MazE/SpoVT family DNA-binding domain-containing protein n=1 Tax=Azospirillum sp. TaxID=34012 RepID=UPI003D74EF22